MFFTRIQISHRTLLDFIRQSIKDSNQADPLPREGDMRVATVISNLQYEYCEFQILTERPGVYLGEPSIINPPVHTPPSSQDF